MQLARYLKAEYVLLEIEHGALSDIDPEKDERRERERLREEVVGELADLFQRTGEIRNRHKFFLDLLNREKKASTAIGRGLAVPHVRSLQPRRLALVFARSIAGVEYASPDGEPVHLFFGIAAPSYDDRVFLQFYKWIAQSFLEEEWLPEALLGARDEHEIVRILGGLR